MELTDKRKIELTGYEMATLIGILRYIRDFKSLGGEYNIIPIKILEKLEKASEDAGED